MDAAAARLIYEAVRNAKSVSVAGQLLKATDPARAASVP